MGGLSRSLAGLAMLLALGVGATAQNVYPVQQVHILVPFPAGGGTDIIARTLGEELSKQWGQAVVMENRPGAGGSVASRALVSSPPDGHTLIVVASGHATNPFLYPKLPYDTFKDFTALSLFASSPNMVLVRADSPLKSFGELLAAARAKPGSLTYAMGGVGTTTHLAGELLKSMAKLEMTAVAYRGGAPSITDLVGGHIPISFNNAPEALGQIKGGTVRALAVTTAERSPFLPDVPTIAEAGVPGYNSEVWWALMGPAGMPAEVVDKIARDCLAVLQRQAVKDRFTTVGAIALGGTSRELDALIRADYEKWGPIIRNAGIKAE